MGHRNYLVDGVSGAGKTTVAEELGRRGYQAVHGDRVLARQGDRVTGLLLDEPVSGWSLEERHLHHIWDVDQVRALIADRGRPVTFFCGGSRNSAMFLDVFDEVFVLEVDTETLHERLDVRPADEFGNGPEERALVLRVHQTREDLPSRGISIDATRPVGHVVDEILRHVNESRGPEHETSAQADRPTKGRVQQKARAERDLCCHDAGHGDLEPAPADGVAGAGVR